MGRFQVDRRRHPAVQRFLPARHTNAPPIARLQSGEAPFRVRRDQIVPHQDGIIEEVARDLRADRVESGVFGPGAAKAVAVEAGHGIATAGMEFCPENIRRHVWTIATGAVSSTENWPHRKGNGKLSGMSERRGKRFVVMAWLLPAEEERNFFQTIIERLAAEFDGPSFQPHLTLGAFPAGSALPRSIETISLPIIGVFSEALFTKTLFVRFRRAVPLRDLRISLGLTGRDYDPHLSLLYSRLSPRKKAVVAKAINLPFEVVRFDQIALVRCVSPTETKAEVKSWQGLASTSRTPPEKPPQLPPKRARTAVQRDSMRGIGCSRRPPTRCGRAACGTA